MYNILPEMLQLESVFFFAPGKADLNCQRHLARRVNSVQLTLDSQSPNLRYKNDLTITLCLHFYSGCIHK